MLWPNDEQVFEFDNSYGLLAKQDDPEQKHHKHWRQRDIGICAAATVLWIRRRLQVGEDITDLYKVGAPRDFEIVHGSYVLVGHGDMNFLLSRQGLKAVRGGQAEHTSEEWRGLLSYMAKTPGMYFCALYGGSPDGHAVGFNTLRPHDLGYWCFDPNAGLFKTQNPDAFIENKEYLVTRYPKFQHVQWGRCVLD